MPQEKLTGNLENIVMSSDESEDESNTDKKSDKDEKVYKIPKITQTHYRKILNFDFITFQYNFF